MSSKLAVMSFLWPHMQLRMVAKLVENDNGRRDMPTSMTKQTRKRIPATADAFEGVNFLEAILNLILLFVAVIEGVLGLAPGDAG